MTDYKDTLNLPHTAFPMKANLAQREPEILARWQTLNLYRRLREQGQDKPKFILHDGPPYANARPHLGTALNKILKDIVLKSKTLSGFDTPYVPGWDCHGLPIELNVEKKIGKVSDKLSSQVFRQACREYAREQVKLQMEDFQRLGVIGDWQQPYLTMDHHYEADIVRALARMIANGHLHRGQKPVHWCTACGSALAEAEVEYQDKASPAIDVAFDMIDLAALAEIFQVKVSATRAIIPIWTTTPWTLPANQAVAVNANFDYVLVKCEWRHQVVVLVFAKALLTSAVQRYGMAHYQVLATVNGELLEGLQLQHPFLNRRVPVILGDHVTIEAGTGCVHTAPAHGQEDYVVGQRYQLPIENPVDSNSCFGPNVPLVAGLHVFKANEPIIAELEKTGHLLHHAVIQHSFPHCWRHKTPLIFRATPQWFVSMDQNRLRSQAITVADRVKWIPGWGKARITNMLEARPDWCISRQRAWGVPIPLFIHQQSGEIHPDTLALLDKVAQLIETQGIDAWYNVDASTLLGEDHAQYEKVTDILDVWFESGLSHFCVLAQRPELAVPADLYLEGSDQHRGWFQSSLLTGVAINHTEPFKEVLTHGYVVDAQGRKMSKSLGNVVVPGEIAKTLGADVLRLWVAASDYKLDINYSGEILKRSVDAYRRIRNTIRFLLANIFDFNPQQDLMPAENLLALDRWAVSEAARLQAEIITAYHAYSFQTIYQKIHNFCSVQMGSFYLDIIKDRQYTSYRNSSARRSAQTAMFHIVEALVRWLAPITSFTAEESSGYIPGERPESIFLTTWYSFPEFKTVTAIDWSQLIPVRDAVNKILETYRQAGKIGSALDVAVTLYAENALLSQLLQLEKELRFVLITSDAKALPAAQRPADVQATEIPGLWVEIIISTQEKCVRCWQRREDVGANPTHPTLCHRCVENLTLPGETRYFA